ncbi:DUF6270 domain-containing protein [Brevibacterium yomogidense]|uniref:DUF6270 domain-containing protein n=1 Tax=Brevibacterium yomogidense TaxID=946573 RepID=UPI0022B7675F|nr:DUF6270 domain-containing protein [Brevibacterium yomogidense]
MPTDSPRIDIWGSCVSRDTLEHMPDVTVGEYIARQSAIVTLGPAATLDVPLELLDSNFQRRMITGDQNADVAERLETSVPALVLVDLIDERRGVWRFPGNRFLTNSVEAYKTGIDTWGPKKGGRLIDFGSNEHFELWKQGFDAVIKRARSKGAPVMLLDIAWAEAFDGRPVARGARSIAGNVGRRMWRGVREMSRAITRGEPLAKSVRRFISPVSSRAETLSLISRQANRDSRRYVRHAAERVDNVVERKPDSVRMDFAHRWGIGPYHYRAEDYVSIAEDIRRFVKG